MKIQQSGIYGEREIPSDEAGGSPITQLKTGASLTDLQKDYVLFTYAPLFLYGCLTHNPVQEWINLNNKGPVVHILRLPKPVFSLNAKPFLDATLWAIEKPDWQSLCLHLGSMGFIDRRKHILMRVLCQEIQIPDVMTKLLDYFIPEVTITTFSVDSNVGCVAFIPMDQTKLLKHPCLKAYPPREETKKLADALFKHKTEPYNDIQPFPWEQKIED